jgi:hypothetical protein
LLLAFAFALGNQVSWGAPSLLVLSFRFASAACSFARRRSSRRLLPFAARAFASKSRLTSEWNFCEWIMAFLSMDNTRGLR